MAHHLKYATLPYFSLKSQTIDLIAVLVSLFSLFYRIGSSILKFDSFGPPYTYCV
jgi:hypothetical protein